MACLSGWTQNAPALPIPYSDWVATDALGRTIAQYPLTGATRPDKYVGIFYLNCHGNHGATGIYDLTQLLKENPTNPAFGPIGKFHFWGKPEAGYYRAGDPWLIQRNLS